MPEGVAGEEQSAYAQEQSNTRRRRNAFRANVYEKEMRKERLRRKRSEKLRIAEEEERKRKENELLEEEAKKKHEIETAKQLELDERQNLTLSQGGKGESNLSDSIVKDAQPIELRISCAACEPRDKRPLQILKYREMTKVLRGCTQNGQMNKSSKYDYICLSGMYAFWYV